MLCSCGVEFQFRTTITTLYTARAIIFFDPKPRVDLLVTANEPETALYKALTVSLLFASHGGLDHTST